jgi:hypothetical protein
MQAQCLAPGDTIYNQNNKLFPMTIKNTCSLLFLATTFLAACSKGSDNNTPEPQCTALTGLKATAAAATVEKGKPLTFTASISSGLTYTWKTPAGATVTTASGGVQSADFSDEGWYRLEAKNGCNQTAKDSVYVDVTLPQGNASCSTTDNTITFTAAGHQGGTFTSITQGENPSIANIYELKAWGGRNEFNVVFHPSHKNNKQPENGVYTTGTWSATNYPAFGERDYDKIYITNITYSPTTIYYRSAPGQKLYVTRVNGKLKVTACDMALTGSSNGTAYSTNTTFSVTEQ